ncbi:MAG: N-formylglutamate amidohydrolase [Pseudomonadales bacterium]|nr:N-formylglutamate amidohydrolase [Pseudomonadales bacterium]
MSRKFARNTPLRELLVVIPHSGVLVPAEIEVDTLSDDFVAALRNVDWYTNWLYNFTDVLDNKQVVFPWCSLLVEANRHPDVLEDAVPMRDVFGIELYKPERAPTFEQRVHLANKYLRVFNRQIETQIAAGAEFLLDGHSTIAAKGVADNQIDIMNFQHSKLDDGPKQYSPDVYGETYAEELQKRLPTLHVTLNASEYYDVYGHVCAAHSVNALSRVGRKVPALCQETCHSLYMAGDHTPDVVAIDHLRRAFADAIHATLEKVRHLRKPPKMIELSNLRQTFDFDCGVKALQGVFAYYGIEERADALIRELNADPELGTSMEAMIDAAERRGFIVDAGTRWTLERLRGELDAGRPVIVPMQAWADRHLTIRQWRENYDDGHYVVVIGYDGPIWYFEDPASFHRTWLKEKEFLARWHDMDPVSGEKLERAAISLRGKDAVGIGVAPMR